MKHYLDYLFEDISFAGKPLLDIGGGYGIYGAWAAIMGAKEVVVLEPEIEASEVGMLDKFKQLESSLSLDNVRFEQVRFQNFNSSGRT